MFREGEDFPRSARVLTPVCQSTTTATLIAEASSAARRPWLSVSVRASCRTRQNPASTTSHSQAIRNAGCLYAATVPALIKAQATTPNNPSSTTLAYHDPSPDQARHTAQPSTATSHSRVSTRLVVLESGASRPGSSPATNGRATIRAVTSPSKLRRSPSGPGLAGNGAASCAARAFLRLPVWVLLLQTL